MCLLAGAKLLHPNYDVRMDSAVFSSNSGLWSLEAPPACRPSPVHGSSSQLLGSVVIYLQTGSQSANNLCCMRALKQRDQTQHKTKTQRHVIIDLIFMFPVFNSGSEVGGIMNICLQFKSRSQPREGGRKG